MKEQKWIQEGLITESFPNGMFRVRFDNQDLILGYVSGKIRCSSIRILTGDKVKVEVSRYDSTKGRIIYRPPILNPNPNKDFKDLEDKVVFIQYDSRYKISGSILFLKT